MGGRGSFSSGGSTGGGVDKDVVGTYNLISEREHDQADVDEVLSVFSDVYDKYGVQVDDIQVVQLKGRSKNGVLAYFDGPNIAVNENYFDAAKMDTAYKLSVAAGFHPSQGDKTGLQAVIAHELGHKLTDVAAVKMGGVSMFSLGTAADTIIEQARKQTNYRGGRQMVSKISGYAKTSSTEAVAEAFADVYCNGSKAHAESIAIVNVLNSYL